MFGEILEIQLQQNNSWMQRIKKISNKIRHYYALCKNKSKNIAKIDHPDHSD
jgi:hypothetical protein